MPAYEVMVKFVVHDIQAGNEQDAVSNVKKEITDAFPSGAIFLDEKATPYASPEQRLKDKQAQEAREHDEFMRKRFR
jgi:hypothetical protein